MASAVASGSVPVQRRHRVAVVVSHPIQHFAPFYRALAKVPALELKVFFCSRMGFDPYFDPGFGVNVRWEGNLLDGYTSEFLDRAEDITTCTFRAVDNPDVGRKLAAFSPDVVQVYGYHHITALRAIEWSRRHRVPVLMMTDSELRHQRSLLTRAVKRLVLPSLLRRVSGFLTIGDCNEEYLRHYGAQPSRLFRSPYPTDEEAFVDARERRAILRPQFRREWDVEDRDFVLLFVGKLIPRKRPGDLVAAAAESARRGVPIRAVFVGEGELRSDLQRQAREEGADELCRFIGFLNQRTLPGAYASADALVHPASVDAHPIAVNEAAIMGLPVIVSDRLGSIGPTDTARPGVNALVYPCGDVSALTESIVRLAADRGHARRMGEASRRVADEMALSASVRGYLQAIEAVTAA